MLLKFGLCQGASDAFLRMGLAARLGQTIGNAPASAGTHAQDGIERLGEGDSPYCAATDLHVGDLGHDQVRALLSKLALHGFAAFYRRPGFDHWPADDALHVHAVYAGVRMKPLLQAQVHDWLHGRNGLMSHADYEFWQPVETEAQTVRSLFLAHNAAEVSS